MSIYIKGMKLPESCGMCDTQGLKNAIWHFGFGCDGDIDDFANCPPARCPLVSVPKHGRLMDKDAFIDGCAALSSNDPHDIAGMEIIKFFMEEIVPTPTIIPEDKE